MGREEERTRVLGHMLAFFGVALLFIIKWTVIITWRFFSGNFMSAREYNDATWWKDASKKYAKMRRKYTWWNRKSRMKRAAWRNAIFWPCLILVIGFMADPIGMFFVVGMLSPGLFLYARKYTRLAFYLPIVAHGSDGSVTQHWVMKPRVRRILETIIRPSDKRRRPGLAMESELKDADSWPDEPMEYRAEVIGQPSTYTIEEQPPIELKLLMEPDEVFE